MCKKLSPSYLLTCSLAVRPSESIDLLNYGRPFFQNNTFIIVYFSGLNMAMTTKSELARKG